MKASSLDVRQQVLTADPHQEGSIRQLAKRFTVSPRFVGELVSRLRRTGSDAPTPHRGGKPPRLEAEGQKRVGTCVPQQPDAPRAERGQLYAERCQVTPSRSSRPRIFALLKLTRKPRLITLQRATALMSKHHGASLTQTSVS